MRVSSFDIFDTCLLRKCGTPENFFDVFAWYAFNNNVDDEVRQEFITARILAQQKAYKASMTLPDIWENFSWEHPALKSCGELCALEQGLEKSVLTPSRKMLDVVNRCRDRGDKILFVSDMYLSSSFLKSILENEGFYKEGDGLYVSCECNAEKWNGSLFRYVHDKEHLTYRNWHHYGDNSDADYKVPRKLGIRTHLVINEYTPFQQAWKHTYHTFGFPTLSIMAGLGRSFIYNNANNIDKPMVYDIIAPFYTTMVYRMMRDAELHGIRRLYFCARDTYMLYHVALSLADLFPTLSLHFLYISKQSLYYGDEVAKGLYFEQQGLASKTDKTAIVDLHSSGKTLVVLNQWMAKHGYQKVRGYYYLMYVRLDLKQYEPDDYYAEGNALYMYKSKRYSTLLSSEILELQEQVFGMNLLNRTIDYEVINGIAKPIFERENVDKEEQHIAIIKDKERRVAEYKQMLETYAEEWKRMQLFRYADTIMSACAMPTLYAFITNSPQCYLEPLLDVSYVTSDATKRSVPLIKKCGWIELLFTHGRDSIWREGTQMISIPQCLHWLITLRNKRRENN